MSVNVMNTVRELAVTWPGATRVFEKIGIDYCCGGGRTLADACATFHVPIDLAIQSLEDAGRTKPADDQINWQARSLTDLIAHIQDTHHVFTRQELGRLEQLVEKVCSRHGEHHPELLRLRELFLLLRDDLLPHLLKEEQVLFPYVIQLEKAVSNETAAPMPFFGTVQNPVRMMMMEHDTVGDLLREMRSACGNYVPPQDACFSYQTLFQALREFEADLHQHIHLENNILFPRAVEMET
ncbi:MAG: iron-sulfur cluster repair di-iron protein [Acidobacteriota bacterium]|nr:iron-sulfur cluster repair di-iron protein [Acidobacteriota bacterium]